MAGADAAGARADCGQARLDGLRHLNALALGQDREDVRGRVGGRDRRESQRRSEASSSNRLGNRRRQLEGGGKRGEQQQQEASEHRRDRDEGRALGARVCN